MKDLYFEKDYGRLYEDIEGGICEEFIVRSAIGEIRHLFIKKPIPLKVDTNIYYDLVTPYGYGGPLITECTDNVYRSELVKQFNTAFLKYCLENNIVSEFVRFHPVILNADDFKSCYEIIFKRKTTGTNLSNFDDPVQEEFSKSTKKKIRKALRAGITYKITVNPSSLKNFKEIYYSTMNRNKAESIYYFDDKYFSDCLSKLGQFIVLTEVIYEEQVIGMGLNFSYNNIVHTHLSGILEEYSHLSPAYILRYAIVSWGKEHGFSLAHYGGGRTSSTEDELYLFKKKFSKNTEFDYFIANKIWNEEIYIQLCEAANVSIDNNFFPAYRTEMK